MMDKNQIVKSMQEAVEKEMARMEVLHESELSNKEDLHKINLET